MPESDQEMLVDGCFLTWVQVTEHYSKNGKITQQTKTFRSEENAK